ncbi:hypothetical protein Goarm_006014 [Gossypium armourianum]|uniref:Uncharacterized protein n=1 Tax=Gossypium armourianum TaxID=34283 RepID=A0A7J9JGP6_9ROSI|nr:hypothetical protein [Gossypium armourianum]
MINNLYSRDWKVKFRTFEKPITKWQIT